MYELLRLRYVLLTALSVSLVPAPTAAREIYKWVDERGATHYGEQLPEGAVASLEVLDVTAAEATPGAGARDYRWTLDLANRLQADRLERERLRLDRQRLRLQQLEVESGNPQPNDAPQTYYVPFYGYPRRPHPRPPYHGKYPGYPPLPHGHLPPGRYPVPDVPKRVYLNRR
jgi:hypothetical protein